MKYKGNTCLSAQPTKAEMPLLGTLGPHERRKPIRVFDGVIYTGRFRLANGGIGQGHEHISRLVRSRRCISMPDRGVLPKIRCARPPEFDVLNDVLKMRGWEGILTNRAGTKKDAEASISMISRTQWMSVDLCLERETGRLLNNYPFKTVEVLFASTLSVD